MPKLLTPKALVETEMIPGMTVNNLAQLRHKGTGPDYVKLGRSVYYRIEDIEAWINKNVRSGTAA